VKIGGVCRIGGGVWWQRPCPCRPGQRQCGLGRPVAKPWVGDGGGAPIAAELWWRLCKRGRTKKRRELLGQGGDDGYEQIGAAPSGQLGVAGASGPPHIHPKFVLDMGMAGQSGHFGQKLGARLGGVCLSVH
jgi:hypothetical protein